MSWIKSFQICLVLLALGSCKKEAGEGGLATLEGMLYYNTYSPSGDFIEKIPAAGENIYLTYGSNDVYDDRNDTYTDGAYKFTNLNKGNYTISAFSDCNCPSGSESIEVEVEITDKKGSTSVSDLAVSKVLDFNDGTATIAGILMEDQYTTSPPIVVDVSYVKPDENVYIVYEDDTAYFDRVKTDLNGIFQFTQLLKGSYRIYAFSDCANCSSGTDTKEVSTQVTKTGQDLNVGTLTIEKR